MRNLLIVDDSDLDRMMIEKLLKGRGFVCVAAEDGVQALERMREWTVDLVLTDLNMPRMDGLELVKEMRNQYPRIPVILTTGVGSEETAAEALSLGASSYIPKNKLADVLFHSVQRVLDILDESIAPQRLHESLKGSRFDFEFSNDPERLRTLVEFIEKTLRVISPLDRNDRLRISMAVDQGLHNAMYRGNLEIGGEYKLPFVSGFGDPQAAELVDQRMHTKPYADRRIQVVCEFKNDRFGIRIRDGGPGFDTKLIGGWENLEARGIILMKAFMHRVEYNEQGNDVQLYYYFDRDEAPRRPTTTTAAKSKQQATRRVGELTCLNTRTVVELGHHKTVVGSRSNCNIRLDEKSGVAPLHCMFVPDAQSWSVVQISPQSNTLINMNPINGRQLLKDGDLLMIGNYEFEFKLFSRPLTKK